MKFLIASDLHGSAYYCRLLLERFREEGAEKLLFLGDVLYHGPRNDLPRDYAPKEVTAMLAGISGDILCVRGNCDCEVDQMVLPFPVLAEYAAVFADGRMFYLTHGHKSTENLPLTAGDILLSGHTHIPAYEKRDGIRHLNPGSLSIPKNGTPHSYVVYENGIFAWKDLVSGEIYRTEILE